MLGLFTSCSTIGKVGPAENLVVQATPERVERGKYLAHHVAICIDCHSSRDWNYFSGPPVNGTWGKGGEVFDQKFDFPGSFISKNITPAGVGAWTDGELFRAITGGVSRDHKPLFPVMQYKSYGQADREDIYSIIAYVRSLPAIENKVADSKADFPVSFLMKTMPQKPVFTTIPDKSDKVAYGKYLTTMASCIECHTEAKRGKRVGPEFAGGFKFKMKNFTVYSKNITPDSATGIGTWSEQQFVSRFKTYADPAYAPKPIAKGENQTIMPWVMYSGMTTEDLSSIYAYLRTVTPVNRIPPPPVFN
jgi:mono/diheme cytochrome c family protein